VVDPSLRILSLCAGVGGLDLGVRIAAPHARTVGYAEIEAYAASVLAARIADGWLDEAPIWLGDLRGIDPAPFRGVVDCIIGGYPCQPFSHAGQRKGADDPRHLWPPIAELVRAIGPRRCFFENVAGHLTLGFDRVAADLQAMGYRVAAGIFSAAEVGASHRRERLFIMADTCGTGPQRSQQCQARHGDGHGPQAHGSTGELRGAWGLPIFAPGPNDPLWTEILGRAPYLEPAIRRVDARLAHRVDELRGCGNGVTSLACAYAYCSLDALLAADGC